MSRLSLLDRLLELYGILANPNIPTDQANAEAIRLLPVLLLEAGAEAGRLEDTLRAVNARSITVELPGPPGQQVIVRLDRKEG